MKPTTHHVREDEKNETKRKNNTKAACDGIKTTWNAGEQQENNPQLQLSSNNATQKISLQQHVNNAAARRASRPTWRQVLSAPVKRNWSNIARVTCEHRQLPLRGNLPQPHSVV